MAEKKIYFPNLDGLRTVAFLIVFFGHCFVLIPFTCAPSIQKAMVILNTHADLGVNFFFVLSGFLISYLLLDEKRKKGSINIRAFYTRRILRIWPVYFFVVLLALILAQLSNPSYSLQNVQFGLVLTFLTNIDLVYHNISSVPLSVLWSVAVEEQFYLVLPLVLVIFKKRVFRVFPIFIVLSFLFRWYHHTNSNIVYYHTFSVASALLVGCILAYCSAEMKLVSFLEKLHRGWIILAYAGLLYVFLYRRALFTGGLGFAADSLIFSLFFGFVIIEQNYCHRSFFKVKNNKWLTNMGKYTYGLYAYHIIFITLIAWAYPAFIGPIKNHWIYFSLYVAALAGSILFSMASYHGLEKPFLSLKEKFSVK